MYAISNEITVKFDVVLDAAGKLQLQHEGNLLSDYEQTVEIESPAGDVTVELHDLAQADGSTQEVTASHEGVPSWARERGQGLVSHVFPTTMVNFVEVTVSAEAKERKVWVKVKPKDSLPDRL